MKDMIAKAKAEKAEADKKKKEELAEGIYR